jgi:hypothetical protein
MQSRMLLPSLLYTCVKSVAVCFEVGDTAEGTKAYRTVYLVLNSVLIYQLYTQLGQTWNCEQTLLHCNYK